MSVPLATTRYPPAAGSTPSGVLVVCSPGGGHGRDTFDVSVDGGPDDSLAGFLAARGHTVVTVDLLGVGPGSPRGDEVTMAAAGEALTAVTRGLLRGASARGIHRVVGLGHSLGGAVTARAAADSGIFDAVALLGYSPAWRSVPDAADRPVGEAEVRRWTFDRLRESDPRLWGDEAISFPTGDGGFAHLADVPEAVREAAADGAPPVPRGIAVDFGIPEPALAAAAAIRQPVLLAFGGVDASTDPATEPDWYPASPAVTLVRLPGSAHCHHVSADRHELWNRLDDWIAATGAEPPPNLDFDDIPTE